MGGIQKNLGGQFTPFLGDQFESAGGGQFETANGGQFVPALGGQFDRHFHYTWQSTKMTIKSFST